MTKAAARPQAVSKLGLAAASATRVALSQRRDLRGLQVVERNGVYNRSSTAIAIKRLDSPGFDASPRIFKPSKLGVIHVLQLIHLQPRTGRSLKCVA